MLISEAMQDLEQYLEAYFYRKQSGIWTSMPGVVNTWNYPNNKQNTVSAVPAVMGYARQSDGTFMATPMPEHLDVPVYYAGGGGFHITHPISQGDEGVLMYQSRCIDGFWQNGATPTKPAAQPDYAIPTEAGARMHDLSDPIFVPFKMSDKNKLQSISTTSCQIRSDDGTSYIEMLPNGGGFNFVTSGGRVSIDGNGNLTATGNITAFDGANHVDAHHVHPNITRGLADSDPPKPGT